MNLIAKTKTGRCPACNYPDEELFKTSGPDAEVDEMCGTCIYEWDCEGIMHRCEWCDGYIVDERIVGAQRFCDEECEAAYQRMHGQGRLFTETAFGLAVAV